MKSKIVTTAIAFALYAALSLPAEEVMQEGGKESGQPAELEVIKGSIGVWDAEVEVWPNGPDNAAMKMKGVETVEAHGQYWLASDLSVDFNGEKMVVHSVVGYDLDEKKLTGWAVDQGPYKAKMVGEYDKDKKMVKWTIHGKNVDGSKMTQHTEITQSSDSERRLVLYMPGEDDKLRKQMVITYKKRKQK